MRSVPILCTLVIAFALMLIWSGYAEYTRRPTEAVELVAVPIRAESEAPKRSRSRAFVVLGTKPCEEISFPPNLLDPLNALVGSKVRFQVELSAGTSYACEGWSASSFDATLPGISTDDVIEQHQQHALLQMLISGALVVGAALLLIFRRRRR